MGQSACRRFASKLDFVLHSPRQRGFARGAWQSGVLPEQRHVGRQRVSMVSSFWPSALSQTWHEVATSTKLFFYRECATRSRKRVGVAVVDVTTGGSTRSRARGHLPRSSPRSIHGRRSSCASNIDRFLSWAASLLSTNGKRIDASVKLPELEHARIVNQRRKRWR